MSGSNGEKLLKSVSIYGSYRKNKTPFFWNTLYVICNFIYILFHSYIASNSYVQFFWQFVFLCKSVKRFSLKESNGRKMQNLENYKDCNQSGLQLWRID